MASTQRKPRSRIYDGIFYARMIDPLLSGVHDYLVSHLPDGSDRVLDACCGTGSLTFRLAAAGKEVIGVDLSPRNIAYAEALRAGPSANPQFEVGDVSQLDRFARDEFDLATIVLALHEMPRECRVPVLKEVARVAARLFVIDYAVPMPWNVAGLRNRAIETTAGPEHYLAFRNYYRAGGLPALASAAGLEIEHQRTLDKGTLAVMQLTA